MIGSTTCFSFADLRDMGSRLFGQIWYKRKWTWVEIEQENEEEGTTLVSLINGDCLTVKTKLIRNMVGYTPALGETCPINWR